MRPSQFVAGLAFLGLVPGSIYLAYLGHQRGLYPYLAVPIAFGVVFAALTGAALYTITKLRRSVD